MEKNSWIGVYNSISINARDKKATTYFSRASKNGLDGVYTVKERKY